MAEALEPPAEPTPETPETPATPVTPATAAPPLETLPATLAESPADATPTEPAPAAEKIVPLLLRQEKTYPSRFRIAVFALGILLGAGIAAFVLLAQREDKKPVPFAVQVAGGGAFGGWRPICTTEFGCDRPHQIAAYVAPKYKLADGKDIVAIVSGRPTIPSQEGGAVDVPVVLERNDRGSRVVYTATDQDNTVQYGLCGFGTNCAIAGTPSVERGDLLRRQALELALLTFRYDDAVKSVLTFFPKPAKAADPAYVLFFRRHDYGAQLLRPLADTLGKQLVLKAGQMSGAQARAVGELTTPRVFKYEYRQTQQGFPILVLTPAAY